jgi:hypothetical protein
MQAANTGNHFPIDGYDGPRSQVLILGLDLFELFWKLEAFQSS